MKFYTFEKITLLLLVLRLYQFIYYSVNIYCIYMPVIIHLLNTEENCIVSSSLSFTGNGMACL